jgi:hypothetical protein
LTQTSQHLAKTYPRKVSTFCIVWLANKLITNGKIGLLIVTAKKQQARAKVLLSARR